MDDMGFAGFGLFGLLVVGFIVLVGALVVGGIIYAVAKSAGQWRNNNAALVLTVPSTIVAKRAEVSGGSGEMSASTYYHVTFELPSRDRLELAVSGKQFGQLAERDRGELTYQGTRYGGFVRTPQDR